MHSISHSITLSHTHTILYIFACPSAMQNWLLIARTGNVRRSCSPIRVAGLPHYLRWPLAHAATSTRARATHQIRGFLAASIFIDTFRLTVYSACGASTCQFTEQLLPLHHTVSSISPVWFACYVAVQFVFVPSPKTYRIMLFKIRSQFCVLLQLSCSAHLV